MCLLSAINFDHIEFSILQPVQIGCSNGLSSAHPYEEPAYEVYKMEDL